MTDSVESSQIEGFFEAAPDALLVTELDGTIRKGNQQARAVLTDGAAELAGRQLDGFVAQIDRQALGEFLECIDEQIGRIRQWDVDLKSDDQTIIPAVVRARAWRGDDDAPIRILWSFRDVDLQEADDSEERLASARLRALLVNAADGIISIDGRGVIQSFNPAAEEMFGWEAGEVIGRKVNMLMPEPHASRHDGYLARYERTGDPHIIGIGREVEGKRKDGSTFPIYLAVSELQLQDRVMYTGIVRDISERKTVEAEREELIEQLEEKNAELERFTYTVSHDLKSPLITIKGFLGMLEQDVEAGNEERVKSDLQRIGAAADKMKELLDELLELSRIGRVVNPSEDVDLGELAEETVELLSGPLQESGVDVERSADLPTVYGDRVRLHEVMQNLIENAIKFMGDQPEPRIEIGVREDDGRQICYVRDNGMGVEPRYKDKVFGLFEQLDQDHDGTGVGLTLVHRIVSVHGGEIWVESEGKGRGATFCFHLPTRHEGEATP